jgi:photosystem II stability/assembly factor-like uncharacterized protein
MTNRRSRLASCFVAAMLVVRPAFTQQPEEKKPGPSFKGEAVVTSLTLFAGTSEGLWRSPDWGGTWTRVVGPSPGDTLESLGTPHALMPLGPQVWVAGDGGLFVSDDFGIAWKRLYDGASALCLMPSRYPQSDPTVFLGTADGLLRSEDAGLTFKATSLADASVSRLEWPGPALVVATSRGVFISEDGGRIFRDRGQGLPEGEVQALAVSSFFAVDPVLFAGGPFGVYRSPDAGRTWKATGLTRSIFDLVWLGPFLYAAGDGGFFRSDDAGQTWTTLSEGLGTRQARRLMFPLAPAAGLEAFVGTSEGLFRTTDGGQHWQPAGLEGRSILSLATFPPPPPAHGKKKK